MHCVLCQFSIALPPLLHNKIAFHHFPFWRTIFLLWCRWRFLCYFYLLSSLIRIFSFFSSRFFQLEEHITLDLVAYCWCSRETHIERVKERKEREYDADDDDDVDEKYITNKWIRFSTLEILCHFSGKWAYMFVPVCRYLSALVLSECWKTCGETVFSSLRKPSNFRRFFTFLEILSFAGARSK